jgi:hypothetical protein
MSDFPKQQKNSEKCQIQYDKLSKMSEVKCPVNVCMIEPKQVRITECCEYLYDRT